jgi:hypothetical protein
MSGLSDALNLLKGQLEVDLIPVIVGALGVLQKNPGPVGVAAAEAYLLGNAPAALLTAETGLLQQTINDLEAQLAKLTPAAPAAKA